MIQRPPAFPIERARLGIRCWPMPLDDGGVHVHTKASARGGRGVKRDGEYSGPGEFNVQRGEDSDVIYVPQPSEEQILAASVRPPWVPYLGLVIYPDSPPSGSVDTYWNLTGEPDPAYYRIVWGAGHEYWLVVVVNGVEIFAGAIYAGQNGHLYHAIAGGVGTPVNGTAHLYTSSSLTTLVASATYATTA